MVCAAAMKPAWVGECVRARTRSGKASVETLVPRIEIACPLHSRRKSRWCQSAIPGSGGGSLFSVVMVMFHLPEEYFHMVRCLRLRNLSKAYPYAISLMQELRVLSRVCPLNKVKVCT